MQAWSRWRAACWSDLSTLQGWPGLSQWELLPGQLGVAVELQGREIEV